MNRNKNSRWVALLGAILLPLALVACGDADAASSCPDAVTQQQVDEAQQKAEKSAGTPSGEADKKAAEVLEACLQQQSSSSTTASSTTSTPDVKDVDDLEKYCDSLEDDQSYLPELPGPTAGNAGRAFTTSTDPEEVGKAVAAGWMEMTASSPEGTVYVSEVNRGAILGSTDPHGAAQTANEAARLRGDADAEQLRKEVCLRAADVLSGALGDSAKVETLTAEDAAKAGVLLHFYVFSDDYKSSDWLCNQQVPPAGIRLFTWERTSSPEFDLPLGETVVVAYERRELAVVGGPCPNVTSNFTGAQAGPEKLEEPAATPSSTAATPDSTTATEQPSGNAGGEGQTGAQPSTGGGGTEETPGPGGAGGQPGGGPAPCTGSPGCPGPGPGGGGEQENPCTSGCPGTSTSSTTTTTTVPPTTVPPTTAPTTTTSTTTSTTTTSTTVPPPTTAVAKDPPPPCFPWLLPGTPGACS